MQINRCEILTVDQKKVNLTDSDYLLTLFHWNRNKSIETVGVRIMASPKCLCYSPQNL